MMDVLDIKQCSAIHRTNYKNLTIIKNNTDVFQIQFRVGYDVHGNHKVVFCLNPSSKENGYFYNLKNGSQQRSPVSCKRICFGRI